MNEPLFERCAMDGDYPFFLVSRGWAQDPTISPNAKGILIYLLSLPPTWKVYHSQLQKALGVGEHYINSAMEELMKAGYAERSREKVQGKFQPYRYVFRQIKKCLPNGKIPPGDLDTQKPDDSKNVYQTGFSGPEKPGLDNIYRENIQQQHAPHADAAASFENKEDSVPIYQTKKESIQKVYPEMTNIDIPLEDKIEICRRYSRDTVKNAIEWAIHPQTKLNKGLSPAIKWACLFKPDVPKTKEDVFKKNCEYAQKFDGLKNNVAEVTVLQSSIEFSFPGSQKWPIVIEFKENGFEEILENTLRKCNLQIKKKG
jgi:hypothetical protein